MPYQFPDLSLEPEGGTDPPRTLFSPLPSLPARREEVEKRFEGRLTKNMSGSLYEMVSRVMKALVNRKITVPGNFQG